MGTCCASCLPAKVRDYASNAENGAVTVTLVKNPPEPPLTGIRDKDWDVAVVWVLSLPRCDICQNHAKFAVSYYPKKE